MGVFEVEFAVLDPATASMLMCGMSRLVACSQCVHLSIIMSALPHEPILALDEISTQRMACLCNTISRRVVI